MPDREGAAEHLIIIGFIHYEAPVASEIKIN